MAATMNGAGRTIDLNAVHRARQEQEAARGDHRPTVILGDKEYTLPATPPATATIAIGRMQHGDLKGFEDVLVALFGAEHVDEILAAGLEMDDIDAIYEGAYKARLGESPASDS